MKALKKLGQVIVLAFLLYSGVGQIIAWTPLEWSVIPMITTGIICLFVSVYFVIKKNEQKLSFIKKINEQKKQIKKLQSELNKASGAIKGAQTYFEKKENYEHINRIAHTFNQNK